MVEFELVEMFMAAGLLVGPASQPVANASAPNASMIKLRFIFFHPFLPRATRATRASIHQSGTPRDNHNSHRAFPRLCDKGQRPPRPKKSVRPAPATGPRRGRARR